MRIIEKGTITVLALASMVVLGVGACQPKGDGGSADLPTPTPETPTEEGELHVVEFFDEISPEDELVTRRVRKIKAHTGDRVRFTTDDRTMWILIPRTKIEEVSGGTDWAKGDSFVAFKIEKDRDIEKGKMGSKIDTDIAKRKSSATVLIRSDYPVPGEEDVFAYSIIEFDRGEWRYHHDESPPRMIIKKR